jgi:2-dehydro-3-deoxy-D-arabinonate dehydratase
MRRIVKTPAGWGLLDNEEDDTTAVALRHSLVEMLQGAPIEPIADGQRLDATTLLAPIDEQEVWAAGVTYERSLEARVEESRQPDVYDRVYEADRPELFFKATAPRVLGPGAAGGIRPDSAWDVPEAEVGIVLDANGRVWGYTIGDDLLSRSIEGENPLYLPQAKVYDGSCVLGPWIVPKADVDPPFDVSLRVEREGAAVFKADTSTAKMARDFDELARWLTAAMSFPSGAVLLTGTGIVPDTDFTLRHGDVVHIAVTGLGTLTHGIK